MYNMIICHRCGGMNWLYRYSTNIKCYACEERICLDDKEKKRLREVFETGTYRKPKEDPYQKQIFKSLGLSHAERKYIYADEKRVMFKFPLKVTLDFSVGGKRVFLSEKDNDSLFDRITQFWEDAVREGGLELQNMIGGEGEPEFYKSISNEAEAREIIKWLVDFKRRFEF